MSPAPIIAHYLEFALLLPPSEAVSHRIWMTLLWQSHPSLCAHTVRVKPEQPEQTAYWCADWDGEIKIIDKVELIFFFLSLFLKALLSFCHEWKETTLCWDDRLVFFKLHFPTCNLTVTSSEGFSEFTDTIRLHPLRVQWSKKFTLNEAVWKSAISSKTPFEQNLTRSL